MRQQSVFNSQSSTQSCIVNCSYLDAICLIMKTNSERRSLLMNGRPIYRSVSRPPTLAAASGDTPAVGKRGCTAGADRANKHSRGLARLRVAATGALPQKMKK